MQGHNSTNIELATDLSVQYFGYVLTRSLLSRIRESRNAERALGTKTISTMSCSKGEKTLWQLYTCTTFLARCVGKSAIEDGKKARGHVDRTKTKEASDKNNNIFAIPNDINKDRVSFVH